MSGILIAGVGYQFMRDLSVGPELVPVLSRVEWPGGVEVLFLHFGPIHMVHWLEERPRYFDRMIFVASVVRGREAGRVYSYRWQRELPDADEIQARVCEAVTGVISLDNLLIIGEHFGVLAPEVLVVEVEPIDTGWGEGFTPEVEALLPEVVETVRRAALETVNA